MRAKCLRAVLQIMCVTSLRIHIHIRSHSQQLAALATAINLLALAQALVQPSGVGQDAWAAGKQEAVLTVLLVEDTLLPALFALYTWL